MQGLSAGTLVALAAFGLAAGVGITAIGPGGVLATAGLLLLTHLSPAGVAGTAIVTHVATGALGTVAYHRSGQLREPGTRRIARILAIVAVVGAPLGVVANGLVSGGAFGVLLAVVVGVTGVLVWLRQRAAPAAPGRAGPPPAALIAAIGLGVSIVAGLFGLGGPMLAVPLLVLAGTPVLRALGAAQAQSVVIAAAGTIGYLIHGSIDWPLAAVVGVPELCGVLVGHRVAHAVPTRWLTYALGAALVALAPWLVLHG
ncbi:MAG TPA: sulfite exporter TauE/SafE family protein [Solirubrobacteraceae bacterium]|nr:sulfite exporter TauE/SafE family protein [Solirubrobacteraceae bacterium]